MINAGLSTFRVVFVALGFTLVTWSYALIQSRHSEGSAESFLRMFTGFAMLMAVVEVMYL